MSDRTQVHQQIANIREQLISDPTVDKFKKDNLDSFVYQPPNLDQPQLSESMDFYEINNNLFKNKEGVSKDDDPFKFFKQAALTVEVPVTFIKEFTFQHSDPQTFAILSIASKFFQQPDLKLKEFMVLGDYLKLQKLRIKNYIYLLRMFTKVDKSPEFYEVVKQKLLHLKDQVKFLEICDFEYDTVSEISRVYKRLETSRQIYDLDDDENDQISNYDLQAEIDNEGNEYLDFFKKASITDAEFPNESYSQALLKEEEKWLVRSLWIEEVIDGFRGRPDQAAWVPWLEAKVDSLIDLDVEFQKTKPLPPSASQDPYQILYLQDFLAEALEAQSQKKKKKSQEVCQDKYSKEQQVYIDQQNIYPKLLIDTKTACNSHDPTITTKFNLRSKFCLKILQREAKTDYFLTVFKRRNFGNEKIYEKRINTGSRKISVKTFALQPQGDFLYVEFLMQPREQSKLQPTTPVRLIFPVQAQFKDPLLVDPNSTTFGFYGEKNFYTYREVSINPANAKELLSPPEGNDDDNSKKFIRFIEYDLHNYQKIKAIDYPKNDLDIIDNQESFDRFGKYKDGFYYFYKQKEINQSKEENYPHYVNRNKEDIQIEIVGVSDNEGFKNQYVLNDKGDKMLAIYWANGLVKVNRFVYSQKGGSKLTGKCFKLDTELRALGALITQTRKHNKKDNLEIKLTPLDGGDFIIAINDIKDKTITIYINEQKVCQMRELEHDQLFYCIEGGVLKRINVVKTVQKPIGKWSPSRIEDRIQESDDGQEEEEKKDDYDNEDENDQNNENEEDNEDNDGATNEDENEKEGSNDDSANSISNFSYNYYNISATQQQNQKYEFITESFPILNRTNVTCSPYMFFIYNHDQLYMKDLRMNGLNGYFYMNNFCGIDQKSRPLTIQCYQNYNTLCLNVPVINSNYKSNEFYLKLMQYTISQQMADSLTFQGSFIVFSLFTYNQDVAKEAYSWSRLITNPEGILDKDIRLKCQGNNLKIEKWDKNSCYQRTVINQYNSLVNREQRNISNIRDSEDKSLSFVQNSYRLMVFQDKEGIKVFTYNQDDFNYQFEFSNPNALESIFEYPDDDMQNPFFDILVDTQVYGQIDLYIMFMNATLRKFSAMIPLEDSKGQDLNFVESNIPYQISRALIETGQILSRKALLDVTQTSNMLYFIANQVFYCERAKPIDMSAEKMTQDGKAIEGLDIPFPFIIKDQTDTFFCALSDGDGKVAFLTYKEELKSFLNNDDEQKYEDPDTNSLIRLYNFMPQVNSRQISQFQQSRFAHPVVTLVDLERGFSSVFTLNLQNTINCEDDQDSYQLNKNLLNHETSTQHRFQKFINLSPGLIVKYFNGIEEKIPLSDKFLNVDRLILSKDGFNILIQGRLLNANLKIEEGFFLYSIDSQDYKVCKLQQIIPFAKINNNNEDVRIKLQKSEIDYDVCLGLYEYDEYSSESQFLPNIGSKESQYISLNAELDVEGSEDEYNCNAPEYQQFVRPKVRLELGEAKPLVLKPKPIQANYTIKRSKLLQEQFKNFDLPMIPEDIIDVFGLKDEEDQENIKKVHISINGDIESEIIYSQPKKPDSDFVKRLERIHDNLHIQVNEEGNIFIINRVSNKIYFFFRDSQYQYQCKKMTVRDFKIMGADTSANLLLLWGTTEYMILDFQYLINGQNPEISQDSGLNFNRQVGFLRKRLSDNCHLKHILPPPEKAQMMNSLIESHNQEIMDCRISGDMVIYTVKEVLDQQNIFYLKIFDHKCNMLLTYFEYDQLVISGDKKYVWLPLQNKVYDIENNLSTLFLWAGGQYNTCGFDNMDSFTVQSNQSVMATQGFLNLSFDFVSACMHDNRFAEEEEEEEQQENGYPIIKSESSLPARSKTISFRNNQLGTEGEEEAFQIDRDHDKEKQLMRDMIDPENSDYKKRHYSLIYKLSGGQSILQKIYSKTIDFTKTMIAENRQQQLTEQLDSFKDQALQLILNYFTRHIGDTTTSPQDCADYIMAFSQGLPIFGYLFEEKRGKAIRRDIVEEVLSFVVQNLSNPIAQHVINEWFHEFIKTADISKAFQQYLNSSIKKTKKMENNLKHPMPQTGMIVDSYKSPIQDDKFVEKFTQPENQKVDVQMDYIFVGDLLSRKGNDIMKTLCSDDKFISVMTLPYINYLVQFQWDQVRDKIEWKSLYPFYALLGLYTVYSLWMVEYRDSRESLIDTGIIGVSFYLVLIFMQSLIIVYFLYREFKQFSIEASEYFSSIWNFSDIISYSLCGLVIFLDIYGSEKKNLLRPVASITLIILWIKMFYYLRAYESTSQLIRMIIEIIKSMKNFMTVFFIGIFSFAGGFYIMQEGLIKKTDITEEDQSKVRFAGGNPIMAFIYTYRLAMGDFSLDSLDSFEDGFEKYFMWIVFLISSLFLVIVLLNLLIAIMGMTFSDVQAKISNLQIREKVLLISENESLFNRDQVFAKAQYLIIIKEGKSESSEAETVENQIMGLKQELVGRVTNLETQFAQQIVESQRNIKKQFNEQEDKQKVILGESNVKQATNLEQHIDQAVSKMNELFSEVKIDVKSQSTIIEALNTQIESIKKDQQALMSAFTKNQVAAN